MIAEFQLVSSLLAFFLIAAAICPCCGIVTNCCPRLPQTLHLSVSGSSGTGCNVDGTYPLTYQTSGGLAGTWAYVPPSTGTPGTSTIQASLACTNTTTPASCGFVLDVEYSSYDAGGNLLLPLSSCFGVSTCGSTSGTWATTSCSPLTLQSNPTTAFPFGSPCGCNFTTNLTFTVML